MSLTEQEKKDYFEAFSYYDKDGDKKITMEELPVVMRAMRLYPTQAQIDAFVKAAGKDKITFDEFVEICVKQKAVTKPEDQGKAATIAAFKVFDKKNTGKIKASDLKHIMSTIGEKLTSAEVDRLMADTGVKADGDVDYVKFAEKLWVHF